MTQSLLIKGAMLVVTIAVVLWIGWPVPQETTPPVPIVQPAPVAQPVAAASPAKVESKIDINHANAAELQALPGVGPVLAQRMVEWRKVHGRYRTVEDLQEVKGIGKKRLEQMRSFVTVKT